MHDKNKGGKPWRTISIDHDLQDKPTTKRKHLKLQIMFSCKVHTIWKSILIEFTASGGWRRFIHAHHGVIEVQKRRDSSLVVVYRLSLRYFLLFVPISKAIAHITQSITSSYTLLQNYNMKLPPKIVLTNIICF